MFRTTKKKKHLQMYTFIVDTRYDEKFINYIKPQNIQR